MVIIKLPKPFGQVLSAYFSNKSFGIIEAYVDSHEYSLTNGLNCLRKHLNLSANDTCSDCYCIIKLNDNEQIAILMEDKDIKTHRSREVNEGKRQLEFTYSKIEENNRHLPSLAFICNAKYEYPLSAKNLSGRKAKVLFNQFKGEPVKLRNTNVEIFVT